MTTSTRAGCLLASFAVIGTNDGLATTVPSRTPVSSSLDQIWLSLLYLIAFLVKQSCIVASLIMGEFFSFILVRADKYLSGYKGSSYVGCVIYF
jgi:hypothetical protein